MSTTTLFFLLLFIAIAILNYYLGFVRQGAFTYLAQASFVAAAAIIFVILILLWQQHTAIDRLSRIGITPPPSIIESVGTGTGLGDQPLWIFRIDATSEDISAFYRDEKNRKGWTIADDMPVMMILKKKDRKLTIHFPLEEINPTIIYRLRTRNKSKEHPRK